MSVLVFLAFFLLSVHGLGPLPDASQESLLWQYKSYANVALFHFIVPAEVTRATWEFASFHDRDGCPSRRVQIYIQQGSFPVFAADQNITFPDNFYLKRTHLDQLHVYSAYQPRNSANYPVYNPLPGSWFVAAFLEPFSETLGFHHKCKYSLGSIALWNKAESVELILPNLPNQNFVTKKHFSYYKFFVPDDVDNFKLKISNCIVRLNERPIGFPGSECIQHVAIRGKALPIHEATSTVGLDVMDDTQSYSNLTLESEAIFVEQRPYQSSYYYILVVTKGQVTFDIGLEFFGCGMKGLYGPGQHDWFLDEKGLMHSEKFNKSQPKEPTAGFQLFSARPHHDDDSDIVKNFDLENNETTAEVSLADAAQCISTFDLTRMDTVTPFSVAFIFQGKSWYTKWITVLEKVPVFASFNILDYVDLGGDLNIKLTLDNTDDDPEPLEAIDIVQEVYVCISKDRQPKLVESFHMSCENRESVIIINNSSKEGLKVIPYPEPGKWFVGFQVRCSQNKSYVPCPDKFRSAMVGVEIRLQPCGSRPMHDLCGEYGVCSTTTKGAFRMSSCSCFGGYKGWSCEDNSMVDESFLVAKTLFLILSNFSFLPAIIFAVYYRLFSEALVYSATMLFSIFYHACDQEASSHGLPIPLQDICQSFYTTNEVLQFCDFYCAILSFWITIVALARLPQKVVNFLNLFGVLLVAFLVQYNRTGIEVLFVPLLLGIVVLVFSLAYKSYMRRRIYLPNRSCFTLLMPASFCSILAASLTAFVETTDNYPYIHSVWHMLMAGALVFLVPRCRDYQGSWKPDIPLSNDPSDAGSIGGNSSTSHCIPSTESSETVSSLPSLRIEGEELRRHIIVSPEHGGSPLATMK